MISRRAKAQVTQAVNWPSRICFIASRIYPGCFWLDLPVWVSRLAVFVNWSLAGEGHKAHRLWTGLRAYVLMASRISPGCFWVDLPPWRYCNVKHLATCSTPEYWFSSVIYSTQRLAARQNIDFLLLFTAFSDLQHTIILIFYCNLQHSATCSTPECWFSIVIYSTWRLAAHQNIDFLL